MQSRRHSLLSVSYTFHPSHLFLHVIVVVVDGDELGVGLEGGGHETICITTAEVVLDGDGGGERGEGLHDCHGDEMNSLTSEARDWRMWLFSLTRDLGSFCVDLRLSL